MAMYALGHHPNLKNSVQGLRIRAMLEDAHAYFSNGLAVQMSYQFLMALKSEVTRSLEHTPPDRTKIPCGDTWLKACNFS